MTVEIEVTDEFKTWFLDLTLPRREAVARVVDMLEQFGIDLPFPYSSSISASKIAMRELRVQHMGEPYRILYVFDPERQAVLLVGGNKVGKGNRWYKSAIRLAERLYDEYLRGV